MNNQDTEWLEEQLRLTAIGEDVVKKAHDEALEYIQDAIPNIADKQWRKMVIGNSPIEMGVGVTLADDIVPKVYKDMQKSLRKKLKVDKAISQAISHIYIGRVIKNIVGGLNGLGDRQRPDN